MPHRLPGTTAPNLSFKVTRYSEDTLAQALQNDWVQEDVIREKQHFKLLREYLGPIAAGGLGARTLVTEWPYISQSYLEDYANYYARCFVPYDRDCKRVHFFGKSFSKSKLLAALIDDASDIWLSYLGYIVVKPIPAPLGATLLRPYPPGHEQAREYPVKRHYRVNVLGKELRIETLIWQQQDSNVSVCATTALWMAFHKTAFMFQTPLPSPYRITESAGNLFTSDGRSFPNQGLDTYQILKSIESLGLVSELRNQFFHPEDRIPLPPAKRIQQLREAKAFIYAYLRLGLPVLISVDFAIGAHLVVATGYRKPAADYAYSEGLEAVEKEEADELTEADASSDNDDKPDNEDEANTEEVRYVARYSDGITKLYVHDDGVGPYSRFGFDEVRGLVVTGWPDDEEEDGNERAHLFELIAPLTADVRIRYEQVYDQVAELTYLFRNFRAAYAAPTDTAPVVWDIYLQYSNAHKQEVLQSTAGTPAQRQRLATRLLPKYIWVARALFKNEPLMELVFDATDLHTGFYCLLTTTYGELRPVLEADFRQEAYYAVDILQQRGIPRYLKLLQDDLGLPIVEL